MRIGSLSGVEFRNGEEVGVANHVIGLSLGMEKE